MKLKTTIALLVALTSPAFSATIFGNTGDAEYNQDQSVSLPGSVTGRVGSSGSLGGGRNTLFVFELPNLGMVANPFGSASLQLRVNTVSGTFTFNTDIYGLGRQSTALLSNTTGVLATNRFYESDATDPNATLIQTDFATPTTGTAGAVLTSNVIGNTNLLAFLNAQYAGGAGAGQFVVLRANPDADTGSNTVGYNFSTANDTADSGARRPLITYSLAIPEPSTALLGSLAAIALLRRRR